MSITFENLSIYIKKSFIYYYTIIYLNSNIFVSFLLYCSGFNPTFFLILSSISTTIIVSMHPKIVNVVEVEVTLNKLDAANVITNLKMFSKRLYDDDIFVRKLTVVN